MKLGLFSVIDRSTPLRALIQTMCPPLGLMYLEAYLRRHEPEVEVLITDSMEELLRFKPDVTGLSAVTENFPAAVALAEEIRKEWGGPLLVGGSHISLLPETLPPVFDIGVLGEGEETAREILRLFRQGRLSDPNSLGEVKGIVFHHPRLGPTVTAQRPRLPLDALPFPLRKGLDQAGYTHVITSRGCSQQCLFCSSPGIWGSLRLRSAPGVVAELKEVKEKIDPPFVKFFDDLFTADRKRLRKMASLLGAEGIRFEKGYGCFARSDHLDKETVGLLKDLDVTTVSIGVESGSQAILNFLQKGTTTAMNQEAIDRCCDKGIEPVCSFVIGVPGEMPADLDATLGFIEKNRGKISHIEVCPVVPFPGTPLWDYGEKEGFVSRNMDWKALRDYSVFVEFNPGSYIYLNREMDRALFGRYCEEFRRVYLEFMRTVETRDVIRKVLRTVTKPGGVKT